MATDDHSGQTSPLKFFPVLIDGILVVVQFGSLAHVPIAIGINRGLSFKIFKLAHYQNF